jgi:hypothetical protein
MTRRPLLIALTLPLLLSACIVVPAHRSYRGDAGYGQPAPVYIDRPPPAPYAEVIPVMPYPGGVWINGYWGWNSGRHQWVPGYWDRPRSGYRYEPHRWEPDGPRWRLRIGGWFRL